MDDTGATARLSRREREIMAALYRLGEATVADVRAELARPPGYDSVRTILRILEEKGRVKHRQVGPRYVYVPTVEKREARSAALQELIKTFFDGSASAAAVALLTLEDASASDDDLKRLRRRIERARRKESGR